LDVIARSKAVKFSIVACGGRKATFDDFSTAIKQNPDVLNLLLVDAEAPLTDKFKEVWTHLKHRDNWERPNNVSDRHCFLMVQCMEAWIIADANNLVRYYDQHFLPRQLPKRKDVENISKDGLMTALFAATKNCQKGQYHKTRHGFALPKTTDPGVVRKAAPNCKRLFDVIAAEMEAVIE
jgi:hypothetical protein